MENAIQFYNEQLNKHKAEAKRLFKKLGLLSLLRLSVFILTIIGIYLLFPKWQIALLIGVIGISVFLVLLSLYTDIKSKRALHKRLIKINENEIKIASGDFLHQPEGKEYLHSKHAFSIDIDMFGRGSFFQFINRTTIKEGENTLVNCLLSNTIKAIEGRQEAIKELATAPEWIQLYSGISQGVTVEHSAHSIITWLKGYKPFLKPIHYWGSIVFSLLSVAILALTIFGLLPIDILVYLIIIGLGITGLYLKRINIIAQQTEKAKDTFRQYALLLEQIEEKAFSSEALIAQQRKIECDGKNASTIFKQFSKALDALDNRNNLVSAIFGNGYLLWDIRQTYHIEKWISAYSEKVADWFEVVTFFDAYNSLANFAFNHPEYIYPNISNGDLTLDSMGLGHPLLAKDKRITSDVKISKGQFFIVTGANMAGKSTFLRTVALHIVMANAGLPVCAKTSNYRPIKLITSMRTTDSLTDDSSYFFSELTRLKFIVETLSTDSNYFVILDEILKGTNSTDKAIGSKKFVEKLVALKATGIIATHDLSLTEIEKELNPVKNYFFDAQIKNDELFFDYRLKEGVCKNMNASFLLKKMNIV